MSEEQEAAKAMEPDPAIKELGDRIAALTLTQAVELGEYLKSEHGIEPAAGVAVVGAGAGPAEVEEVEEQTMFDVILKNAGGERIKAIKAVRALTSLSLTEAKELVDSAPKPVKQGVSKEEAEEAFKQLTEAGTIAEIV